jgi:hypothetical protein
LPFLPFLGGGRESPDDEKVSFLLVVLWSKEWGQPPD